MKPQLEFTCLGFFNFGCALCLIQRSRFIQHGLALVGTSVLLSNDEEGVDVKMKKTLR